MSHLLPTIYINKTGRAQFGFKMPSAQETNHFAFKFHFKCVVMSPVIYMLAPMYIFTGLKQQRYKWNLKYGCGLSSLLLNAYSEEIFNELLDETDAGVLVNHVYINNIRFADDKSFLQAVPRVCKISLTTMLKRRIWIIHKLQYISSKNKIPPNPFKVNDKGMKRVETCSYYGTTINNQWDYSQKIKYRFQKMTCKLENS